MVSFFTERNFEQKFGIFFLALAFFMALIQTSYAHDYKVGSLHIEHPWSRATPAGARVGGGYFIVKNATENADRLVSIHSDVSERVEIHEMAVTDGIMKMRRLDNGVEIPAKGEIALKPGSYHVMFIGLKQPLLEGESFKGTLKFEKAGAVEVSFKVEAMGKEHNGDQHGGKSDTSHGHGHH